MPPEESRSADPWSRSEYRRLIAWGDRIQREAPFLLRLLDSAPDRSVLDLGCATGEHVAWFAQQGARAVGVDSSESMIEQAREHERAGHGRFVEADALGLREPLADEPRFGLAICLGNMLPHVLEEAELCRMVTGVHEMLLPNGLFLLQILNYERILAQGIRHLPLNFLAGDRDGEEILFLRVMKQAPPDRLLFFPTTLTVDETSEEPVRVRQSRRVELHPWRAEELERILGESGFIPSHHGDMTGRAFDPARSNDLVIIATRT